MVLVQSVEGKNVKREERAQLGAIVDEVTSWVRQARTAGFLAEHMPLSGRVNLSSDDATLLGDVALADGSHDLEAADSLRRSRLFTGRKKLQPAHEAAARVGAFHDYMTTTQRGAALGQLCQRLIDQHERERANVAATLEALFALRFDANEALELSKHLPLTRSGVLTADERTSMESLVRLYDLHATPTAELLEGQACGTGQCSELHTSAALLHAVHTEARSSGNARQITEASERLTKQAKAESRELQKLVEKARGWEGRAKTVRSKRQDARAAIAERGREVLTSKHTLRLGSENLRLAALTTADAALMRHLALLRDSPLAAQDDQALTKATQDTASQLGLIQGASAWECARDLRCKPGHEAASDLRAGAADIDALLGRLERGPKAVPDLDRLLEPSLGFAEQAKRPSQQLALVDAQLTARARSGVGSVINASKAAKTAAKAGKEAANVVRAADVATTLKSMDLDVLRRASPDRLRTGPLANAGMTSVWDVLAYERSKRRLVDLPGLGEGSALAVSQAALRLEQGVRDETPVRIDVKKRGKRTQELLIALRSWDAVRRFEPSSEELSVAQCLAGVLAEKRSASHVLVVSDGSEGAAALPAVLGSTLDRAHSASDESDIWTDFLSRPADYFGMLTELGFLTEDEKKMHGDLPEEVIEAVRAIELKKGFLKASLRAYQDFGARFVLAQKKVVIGDEMGLGKTVEALAVLTHLRATGQTHFVVVCPAAVVSNWMREIAKHTELKATRIHGPSWERAYSIKRWLYNGGVAVTTFDLARDLLPDIGTTDVACAIFDEAHYIKNPAAKRSIAAASLLDRVPYAILMTGTPLENRVQEFRNLIGYIRPDLSEGAPDYLPSKFRKHVAPAYLRRNQEDVLTELPELVEVEEWMPMSPADARDYRAAVEESHFMKMRRAAMLSGESTKLSRLTEIVGEAEANGRRVIVFSYFREVLDEVARTLPGPVFGPLTGSVPARDRQAMVDRFSDASHGAALVAQITAGGVGLNIQSASVVVICEPQIKPTMEAQAIARAHRMGQVNSVQVHRLLSEDSVDERMVDILAEKRVLFDEFARDSVIAQQAPDALDMSDAELARAVIAAERERLLGDHASGDTSESADD